jgi:hypothetical protein
MVTALLWVGAAKIEQVHERRVATSAVEAIATIQLGSTTRSQAEALLTKYSAYRVTGLGDEAIQLGFTNRRGLIFAKPSQWIWITLELQQERVISRSMQFAEEPRRSAIVRQSVLPTPIMSLTGKLNHRNVDFAGQADSPYSILRVDEDTKVPSHQLTADWRFDFRCFQFMSGCKSMADVLTGAQIARPF